MMYLIDSGVWIGAANPRDAHHKEAGMVLKAVSEGKLGTVVITDLIFAEVVTYLRKKIGPKMSVDAARILIDSKYVEVAHVDEHIFNAAYHMFEKYPRLSFADAMSVALAKDRGIQQIVSFDSDFDGIRDISRVESV